MLVSGHFCQTDLAAGAYRIPNNEVLAFDTSGGRPRCRRPGFDELGRLTFQFRVFLDSLDGDLRASNEWVRQKHGIGVVPSPARDRQIVEP